MINKYNPNCAVCQGRGIYTTSNTSGTQSMTRVCDCYIFYDIKENSQNVDADVVDMVNEKFWDLI